MKSLLFEPKSLKEENWSEQEVKNALRANASKSSHAIVQTIGFDVYNMASTGDVAKTLNSIATDSDHTPVGCYGISAYNCNAMKSINPHSGIYEATTSRTLDLNGGNPACNQGGMVVCCLNDQGGAVMDVSDKAGTLRAQEHGHQPIICFKERAGKPGGAKES